jgi:hypothetical protein
VESRIYHFRKCAAMVRGEWQRCRWCQQRQWWQSVGRGCQHTWPDFMSAALRFLIGSLGLDGPRDLLKILASKNCHIFGTLEQHVPTPSLWGEDQRTRAWKWTCPFLDGVSELHREDGLQRPPRTRRPPPDLLDVVGFSYRFFLTRVNATLRLKKRTALE